MNERMLADIAVFLLTWILNILLLESVLTGVGLGWQILILCTVDFLTWVTAEKLGVFE